MGFSTVHIILGSVLLLVSIAEISAQQRGRGQYARREQLQVPAEDQPATLRPKVFETHREIAPNLGDGSFKYYSATSDGLESEQLGHFSNPLDSQVHQGSYTTKDEHGQVVKVDYIADKAGFRPIGAGGAPVLPTPPPVPLEHLIAHRDILSLQAKIREQHLGYLRAGYAAHGR